MPDVDYHGWTHRPKALGGTDPVEIQSLQPFAYSFFSGKTIDDSTSYVLTALSTSSYIGTGIADQIGIGNSTLGTFMVKPDTQDILWVVGDPCVVAFDVEAYFSAEFDGEITLFFDQANYGHAGYTSPTADVLQTVYQASSSEASHTVRLSGIVYMDPEPYDPDISVNGNSALVIGIQQDSGSSRTIGQGWVSLCRVTTGAVDQTYTT